MASLIFEKETEDYWVFWNEDDESNVNVPINLAHNKAIALMIARQMVVCEERGYRIGHECGRQSMASDLRRLIGAEKDEQRQ